MTDNEIMQLIAEAKRARENAYAPYSKFKVGAALLTKSDRVFIGSNVENAAYGAGTCAERTAVHSAVANGERYFTAIAVVADTDGLCSPCGICRQVVSEFGDDILVIRSNLRGEYDIHPISYYLPGAFRNSDMPGAECDC